MQQECFSGILVPLVSKVSAATEAAFGQMNLALKKRAEHIESCHVAAH